MKRFNLIAASLTIAAALLAGCRNGGDRPSGWDAVLDCYDSMADLFLAGDAGQEEFSSRRVALDSMLKTVQGRPDSIQTARFRNITEKYEKDYALNKDARPAQASVSKAGNIIFPDHNFKAVLLTLSADGSDGGPRIDADGNGEISLEEAKTVTEIVAPWQNISSVAGIEYFPNLKYLNCCYNNVTHIDASRNRTLENLQFGCYVTHLDVSHNPGLKVLNCSFNRLSYLDISHNPNLEVLFCNDNKLTSIDLSKSPKLWDLVCGSNLLDTLDVSHNPKLVRVEVYGCNIKGIDVSMLPELRQLNVGSCKVTSLDVSHNPLLFKLTCDTNPLSKLDISHNPRLTILECYQGRLKSLDATTMTDGTGPMMKEWAKGTNYDLYDMGSGSALNIYCGLQKDSLGAPITLDLRLRPAQSARWQRLSTHKFNVRVRPSSTPHSAY
jgi:hypothetical protein